jgi:iron(III) transport system permease protein
MLCVGLAAFLLQRAVVGRRSYVSVTGKGDVGLPTKLPRPVKITALRHRHPLGDPDDHRVRQGDGRRLRARLGPRLDTNFLPLQARLRAGMGRRWPPAVSAAAPGTALFTTIQLAAVASPITAGLGLLAAWVLTRQRFAAAPRWNSR